MTRSRTHSPRATRASAWFALLATLMLSGVAYGQSTRYTCLQPESPSDELLAAFRTFHTCTSEALEDWLDEHPAETAQLEELYQAWMAGREHDLRDRPEAAQWTQRHSTNFARRDVSLTGAQVTQHLPAHHGPPVSVEGILQRIFVDRDAQRLFLTTSTEGLLSISTARRWDFQLEGSMERASGSDFFIIDGQWAYLEEEGVQGGGRDLIVLDISNPSRPREVRRLTGVLPSLGGTAHFDSSMAKRPPTFDEYVALREGRMTTAACSALPRLSAHPNVHCSPDGRCHRRVTQSERRGLDCVAEPAPVVRPMPGRPVGPGPVPRRGAVMMDEPMAVGSGMGAPRPSVAQRSMAESAPAPPARPEGAAPQAPAMEVADAGAEGGAGALTQMMRHGNALYVLTMQPGQRRGWLTTFDISSPARPRVTRVQQLDNGPEALQRHDNLLLVAGRDALMTVSVGEPTAPRLLGEYRQECPVNYDPVVVDGSMAYRTIIVNDRRTLCTSRLETIDLSQPHQPLLRNTQALQRPRGLAVYGGVLFVADEASGVVLFDLADPTRPSQTHVWSMPGVQDLVLSGFDLYAMSAREVQTFAVAPLFEAGVRRKSAAESLDVRTTVVSARGASALR